MNQTAQNSASLPADTAAENPPYSRKELIRRNIPCRGYESDMRELEEVFRGLVGNRPAGSEVYTGQASDTGNVWVLSRSGVVLSMRLHPAVQWAHFLSILYGAPEGHQCVAPDPNKWVELGMHEDHPWDWNPPTV